MRGATTDVRSHKQLALELVGTRGESCRRWRAGRPGPGKAWCPSSRHHLASGYLLAPPGFSGPLLLSLALERGPAVLWTLDTPSEWAYVTVLTPDSQVISYAVFLVSRKKGLSY